MCHDGLCGRAGAGWSREEQSKVPGSPSALVLCDFENQTVHLPVSQTEALGRLCPCLCRPALTGTCLYCLCPSPSGLCVLMGRVGRSPTGLESRREPLHWDGPVSTQLLWHLSVPVPCWL